jgi:DHA2 family multidrug resistance protein
VSAPSGVTAIITSILVARLMRRYDARMLAAASFGFYALSYFMHAGLTTDANLFAFVAPQLVQGFAMGLFFSNFLRITAGSFATSLITTFWDRRETLHQSHLADSVSVYAPAYQQSLAQMHQFGLTDQAAAGVMTRGLISITA